MPVRLWAHSVIMRGINGTPSPCRMCGQLGLSAPLDVAVLGVDNDELECLLSRPPLSSIVSPAEQIGHEAARQLDRIMSGKRLSRKTVLVPPSHVVVRESTDIIAIADSDVSAAMAVIRDHAAECVGVADVVECLSIARRGLERRLRKLLGRFVLDEIQRVRIEHAKRLLVEADLPVSTLAGRCGSSTPQRLAATFRRLTGCTSLAYRRRTRLPP